jgi:hypothetical protein
VRPQLGLLKPKLEIKKFQEGIRLEMIHKNCRILSWQQQKLVEMKLIYKICCKEQSLEWARLPPHHQE